MTLKEFKENLKSISDDELEKLRKEWQHALSCKQMHEPGNELIALGIIAEEKRLRALRKP